MNNATTATAMISHMNECASEEASTCLCCTTILSIQLSIDYKTLNQRNKRVLEKIAGDRLPPEPMEVIRLHMELYDEYAKDTIYAEDAEIFRR